MLTVVWILLAGAVLVVIGRLAVTASSRRLFGFVLAVPVVNALTSATINVFPQGGLHGGYARLAIVSAFALFAVWRVRFRLAELPIYVFVLYLVLATMLSTDVIQSAKVTWGVFLSFAMFVIAREYFDSAEKFRALHQSAILAAGIIIAQLAIAQVTGFGRAVYVEDALRLGGAGVGVTYNLAYTVLLFPLMLAVPTSTRRKVLTSVLIALCAATVLLIFRRGSLFGMLAGLGIYTMFGARRRRLAPYAALAAAGAAVVLYAYGDVFMELWRVRTDLDRYASGTAGRAVEWGLIMDEWRDADLLPIIFGKELFNSHAHFGMGRNLHVDYFVLLHGAGLVGLALYLISMVAITWNIWLLAGKVSDSNQRRDLRATLIALVAAASIMSYSRQIGNITALSFVLIYLGAISGMLLSGAWSSAERARSGMVNRRVSRAKVRRLPVSR